MFSGPYTTALALRGKWSLYNDHGYGSRSCPRHYVPCSHSSSSLLFGVPRNPRFLYHGYLLRRHSGFFQLEPSRAFLLPRRTVRVRVCYGGFDEVVGLLGEGEDSCRCRCKCCDDDDADADGGLKKSSRKEASWSGERGGWSKSDRNSVKSLDFSGDPERREDFDRNERNRKVFDRRSRDKEENVAYRRDSGRQARENYNSTNSAFLGDFEDKRGVERRRVVGESSRSACKKDYGFGRVDVKEKVVREIQKYEHDNETNKKGFDRRFTEEEEEDTYWRDSTHEATEDEVIYERSRKKVGSQGENSNERASSSRREVSDHRSRVEEENIDDYVHEEHEDSRKLTRTSDLDRYTEYKTGSKLKNVDRGESSASSVKRQSEIDKQVVRQADSRKSSLRNSSIETVSNSQRRSEEERAQNLVQVSRDRRQNDQMSVDKVEVNKQRATCIDASDNRLKTYLEIRRDDEIASSSQWRFEEEKSTKEKSSSVENLVRVRRDERTQVNQQSMNEEFSEQYENQTSSSRVQVSGTQRIDNSNGSLQIRTDDQEEHSTSAVNLVNRVRGNSRVESEENPRISEIRQSNIERISNLKEATTIRMENQKETSSSTVVQDEIDYRRCTDLIGESSQSTQTRIGISGSLHVDSSSIYQVKYDAIESASRLDESSAMYVGEFVDKVRTETLASDSPEVTVEVGYKEQNIEESGKQSSSRSRIKGPSDEMWEVRATSSQEPSKIEETNEHPSIVDVVGSKAAPVISENAIARISHRSLWAYIADILKIGHRAGSHNSTQKSGTRSSSNESVSGEAWFSGQESDEDNDEAEKKGKARSPKETVPSKRSTIESQVSTSTGTERREEIEWSEGEKGTISTSLTGIGIGIDRPMLEEEFGRHKVAGTGGLKKRNVLPKIPTGKPVEELHLAPSTSMGPMRKDSSSEGATLASRPEDEPSKTEKGRKFVLSSGEHASASVMAPPSIPEIGSAQMPGIGFPKSDEITEVEKLLGDGELKRRKLQRSKQVLTEQFDEWEEAYKHDSEQRKIDEFFMREALLEAQKAADTWEVPVGAVLVQNGKIIARGCNLVEELRDSTAHAEMICIRQASNILRSWRLAESTLYVTLEPCAMCAGAILQARIDTVVWGAPNKLLGADGSWVRLFPTSGDASSSSATFDPSNQITGPVHPFHPKITIRRGILTTECSEAMQQFFQLRRKKKNKIQEQPSPPPSCLPISTQPTKLVAKMHDLFSTMFCL